MAAEADLTAEADPAAEDDTEKDRKGRQSSLSALSVTTVIEGVIFVG